MSSIRAAIGLMLILLAVFAGILGYFVAMGVRQTQTRLEERSAAAAQVVSTNANWIAELAFQTLRRVDAALGESMSGDPEELRPALEGLPSVVDVYIIDADAQTIFSTVDGADKVSVSDREYFTALRDGAPFYMSPLIVSRLTGEGIFVFSKRVVRNGQFAGAIMVSYSQSLLEDLWLTLDLDEGSTVSLIRDDGQLMARFPPPEGPMDLSGLPLFTQLLPAADTGTYTSERSPVDGIARVVSYRRVPGTKIVALASVASDEAWRAFNTAVWTVLLIVSPIVLGLVLGCWWIVRLLYRDARKTSELQASVELNTMLFREIHHRVKNNLQSIQSLVRMQDIPDAAKRDLQSRFAAMAAMHEHIYKHDRYLDIDAHDFVPAVVEQINAVYGSSAELHYDIAHVPIDRDHATPLALLLSELVTNAFKYAFPEGRAGRITISIQPLDSGRSRLIVSDNGVGMSAEKPASGMGMRLIRGIVSQMDGTFTFHSDGGTVFDAELALTTGVRAPNAGGQA